VDPRSSDPIDATAAAEPRPDPRRVSQGDLEPAADAAPGLAAVTAPTQMVGASRVRWLVGGGLAVAAVAALVLAAALLGASPLPDALKYVPADSAVVVELRPELPGDQRQHVGNFLAHFPGFEDQSTLSDKIDEALARIIDDATNGQIDYATRVKPLLAGPMAISVSADAFGSMASGNSPTGYLAIATTDGAVSCDTVFGATTALETYREVEIRSVGADLACAVHDRYLLAGTADSIHDGLDARLDGAGIDTSAKYKAARAAVEGDQLATFYLDGTPLVDLMRDATAGLGAVIPDLGSDFWAMEGLRVIDDAIVLDAYGAPLEAADLASGAPTSAAASESRFAAHLPAGSLGFVEIHGVGAYLGQALAALRADATQADVLTQIEDALRVLGGTDNLTSWIEEVGAAAVPTSDGVGAALLVRGVDADAAAARAAQIRNLLVLASTGSDITIRDTDHDGVTITTVDLGDVSSLLGGLGMSTTDVAGPRVEISFAVRDDLLIVGVGNGVVEQILDVESGSSLAAASTYGHATDLAGATSSVHVFVALDSIVEHVGAMLSPDELATFQGDLAPYLEHLAGAAVSSSMSNGGNHMRWVITVK